jgi:tRNA-guanine transglycosylase
LREESTAFIGSEGFDGFAIGGSLGRSKADMHQVLDWTAPHLPTTKPRHLLGIGDIEDIFEIVKRGIDLFDCVAPTRMARTGTLLVADADRFRIHVLNAQFREDRLPIDPGCSCYTCSNYSRAYLRHLFLAKELSAIRLATIHNLFFLESLMVEIRKAIKDQCLDALHEKWIS